MSFADELRSSYPRDSKHERERLIEALSNNVVEAVKTTCARAASKGRSAGGYCAYNGDEYVLGPQAGAMKFLYGPIQDRKYEKHKDAIKHFQFHLPLVLTPQEAQAIVSKADRSMRELGFSRYSVRCDNVKVSLKYGHTEFLLRDKCLELPGFVIYAEASW